MALYDNPTARIRVNGTLSKPVYIRNGTQQGCLLLPLLYILAMEHLAQAIRDNPSIRGMEVGGEHSKVSLFTDYLLIYVSIPRVALPSLLEEFRSFGSVSKFRVNMTKSMLLNVTIPQQDQLALQNAYPFM